MIIVTTVMTIIIFAIFSFFMTKEMSNITEKM